MEEASHLMQWFEHLLALGITVSQEYSPVSVCVHVCVCEMKHE